MLRAALYIRVSTEEQAREGYSLDAQRAHLLEYAKKHEYQVVDIYADEGASARKKPTKRKALMRLIEDVELGKIDIILFFRLDRWFRNVGDYYKIQEVLNKCKVAWKATTEDYDTTSANGQLNLNFHLIIAQNESDRTSERIKFVFDEMVRDGKRIGGKIAIGYKVEDGRLVVDETKAPVVIDFFETYLRLRSVRGALLYINEKYPFLRYQYDTARTLLRNTKYIGKYRDNENYCPAIVSKELFYEVQRVLDETALRSQSQRKNTEYVYLFSGLVRCPVCGGATSGVSQRNKYHYYRCNLATRQKECSNNKNIREDLIESYLLEHIAQEVEAYQVKYQLREEKAVSSQTSIKDLERKLSRLRDLYVDELIQIDDYKKEYERLTTALKEAKTEVIEKKDFSHLEKVLSSSFRDMYQYLSNEDKRALWHSIIKSIEVEGKNVSVTLK